MTRPPYLHALDDTDDSLTLLPYAARRALDHAGKKLSLEGFRSLSWDARARLATAGLDTPVDDAKVGDAIAQATPPATSADKFADPPVDRPTEEMMAKLPGPIPVARWQAMTTLDRYVLAKRTAKGDAAPIAEAYRVIVEGLARAPTHLDERGEARMVSIAPKPITERRAVASARVHMKRATREAISARTTAKGDVLATAKIAGIMAAKKTHELIPLCHPVALTHVDVTFVDDGDDVIVVRATAEATDRTGVEMEALIAASTAALTIYDMVKSIDRWMTIEAVRLEEKSGGRSGDVFR